MHKKTPRREPIGEIKGHEIVMDDNIAANPESAGIDYLSGFIYGEFTVEWLDLVEAAQVEAKTDWLPRYFEYRGLMWEVLPGGAGPPGVHRRKYQVNCSGIHLGVCDTSTDCSKPALKLEMKGSILFEKGAKEAFKLAVALLEKISFRYRESRLSRVDIRADFSSFDVEEIFCHFREKRLVTKARKFPMWFDGNGRCQSLYCGQPKSPVQCRFYDKLAETESNEDKRAALEEVYGELPEVLTRVEFQVRRDVITDRYKISSFEDLFLSLGRITNDLTMNWLRIETVSKEDNNSGRRRLDTSKRAPIWETVRGSFLKWAESFGDRAVRRFDRCGQTVTHARKVALTSLARFIAVVGKECPTMEDLTGFVREQIGKVYGMPEFTRKCSETKRLIEKRNLARASDWFDDRGLPPNPPLGHLFRI